ncbi:MAG: MotA/TolQ/ExbB proton channel family protein [Candidatus Margulisiibacteriota bacterium]
MRLDIFIILGFLSALAVFRFAISDIMISPQSYLQFESLVLVIGGVISTTIMMSSGKDMARLIKLLFYTIFPPKLPSPEEAAKQVIVLSEMYHRSGRLSLEGQGIKFGDGFLGRGVQTVVDRIEPEFVRTIMENEIYETQKRHSHMQNMFRSMSSFSPMFGLIGTVVGIIQVLKNLNDPSQIGAAMSLALLTSLYGLIFSVMIFLPIANKLKKRTDEELLVKEIILEGIILIAKEEIPLKVERYLHGFLDSKSRQKGKAN